MTRAHANSGQPPDRRTLALAFGASVLAGVVLFGLLLLIFGGSKTEPPEAIGLAVEAGSSTLVPGPASETVDGGGAPLILEHAPSEDMPRRTAERRAVAEGSPSASSDAASADPTSEMPSMVRIDGPTTVVLVGGREVTAGSFWIDVTEVTVAAFRGCVVAGACREPGSWGGCTWGDSDGQLPINCVSRSDARDFCDWRHSSYRLPKESEWIVAAWGGHDIPLLGISQPTAKRIAWWDGNSGERPRPVARLERNGYRLFDMFGNVAEWTMTQRDSKYVVHGGSFRSRLAGLTLKPTARLRGSDREVWVGFRCAQGGD